MKEVLHQKVSEVVLTCKSLTSFRGYLNLSVMRVLFDVSSLDRAGASGVATYTRHLAECLRRDPEIELVGSWDLRHYRSLKVIRQNWSGPLYPFWPIWSQIHPGPYAVFHGPAGWIPSVRGRPRVVTIHDLAVFEKGFAAENWAQPRRAALESLFRQQKPEAIIAVSHFVKKQIEERFPSTIGSVYVVWHGADHLLLPTHRGSRRPLQEPYFLFVGNLEIRKNVLGLLAAFSILKQKKEHADTRLILVGKSGFGFDRIKQQVQESPFRDHILMPGFVPHLELVRYYQWAEAFVYPSFYEGFGFPVLEAMRLGCPVVTTPTAAIPEIAGEAVLYVQPSEIEDLALGMEKIVSDTELRKKFIIKGRHRGLMFTWKRCAKKTKNIYKWVMKENKGRSIGIPG